MFLTYRPKFLHMAERILRSREDAEDAVQNAFISAFLHLRNFEGRSALRTWFTRVVLNAAFMIRRRRQTSRLGQWPETKSPDERDWAETLPGSQPDPEMIYAKKEIFRQIHAGLGTLKPILRQAFEMIYYRQMTISEASEFLGIPVGTLKARLFRARRQLASPSCQQLKPTSSQATYSG
jgi:RNA polymerase sigma-70 factor (ECF subfamily)